MNYILIDPPVSPFSSVDELSSWLEELKKLEDTAEVREAIQQAERWIQQASEVSASRSGQ